MLGPYVPGDRAADLVEVGRFRTRREAEEQALVLLAVGIGCRLLSDAGRVRLLVAAGEGERAAWELATYERENRATARPPPVARPAAQGVDAALAYCAVLLFFFVANSTRAFSVDWSAAGDAQADLIRHGAWWRTLTALSLHGDLGHLASNLAAGLVFGLLLSQLLGWGLAWLAIVVAGGLGNGLDALLRFEPHAAVGASTALFGALGVLAGYWRRARTIPWRGGIRRWAPLAGGVMLLVFLGTSGERTDVGAHVAGFAVGGLIGLGLAQAGTRVPTGTRAQGLYGAMAAGVFAIAWVIALATLK